MQPEKVLVDIVARSKHGILLPAAKRSLVIGTLTLADLIRLCLGLDEPYRICGC